MNHILDGYQKFFRRPTRGIGRGKKNSPIMQQWQGRRNKFAVISLGLKHSGLFRLRKGRRIKQDHIERPLLFAQPAQPIEGIAIDELMLGRIDIVQRKIASAELEIFFRKIDADRSRARFGRANGKCASIGERVEHGDIRLRTSAS